MTVLIAVRAENSVWIGGDCRVSQNGTTICDNFPKWRKHGDLWWSSAGYQRIYQLADRKIYSTVPKQHPLDLCEAIRLEVIADSWSTDHCQGGAPVDYQFDLLATDGARIVKYRGDGSAVVLHSLGTILAIGSGEEYALGAATAVLPVEGAEMAVHAALAAATRFSQSCGGDLFIKEIMP